MSTFKWQLFLLSLILTNLIIRTPVHQNNFHRSATGFESQISSDLIIDLRTVRNGSGLLKGQWIQIMGEEFTHDRPHINDI